MPNTTKKWKNIVSCIFEGRADFRHHMRRLLTDDSQRIRVQFFAVFLIFTVVSAVMTVINLVTAEWQRLLFATALFTVMSLLNAVLMLISHWTEILSRYLFAVEMTVLFAFFIITGEPQGFSAIWIILLPASGLLLYRLKYGSLLSLFNLLMLIFFFWTTQGRSFLSYLGYSESFRLRFPVLYCAALAVGFFFEYIRSATQSELSAMRERYQHLSMHDQLTTLYNRTGFYSCLDALSMPIEETGCAFALIDFDNFKSVNDHYGHLCGDIVLKETADIILDTVGSNGCVCRWGGDEIAVYFYEPAEAEALCRTVMQRVRDHEYHYADIILHNTLSVGLTMVQKGDRCSLHELIAVVDKNLYVTKAKGKNDITVTHYAPPFSDHVQEIVCKK